MRPYRHGRNQTERKPAKFDEVYADLNAKMTAAMNIIAQDPALAAQVKAAIDNAHNNDEIVEQIVEQQMQDEARANALATSMQAVRDILNAVVPTEEGS